MMAEVTCLDVAAYRVTGIVSTLTIWRGGKKTKSFYGVVRSIRHSIYSQRYHHGVSSVSE